MGGRFYISGGAPFNIFRVRTDGTGSEERVLESQDCSESTIGRAMDVSLFTISVHPRPGRDLWTLAVTPEGRPAPGAKPRPFARELFNEDRGRFSPDARWVAYQSDESGR